MQPRIVKSELNLAQTIHLFLRVAVSLGEYTKALEEAEAFIKACWAQGVNAGEAVHQFTMQTNGEFEDFIGRRMTYKERRRVALLLEELAEKIRNT